MREYKFRVWDTENKEMLKVQELDFEDTFYGGRLSIRTDQYNDYFDIEDMILMQYTGLKDRNMKEIYEGDIIKIKHEFDNTEYICEIIYVDGAFRTKKFIFGSYYDCLYYWYANDCEIEIIGNVWEDSDLLNDNKNTENY